MKIITIYGSKVSGKTNVVRNIHQKICRMSDAKLIGYKTCGSDNCDFDSIFDLKGKVIVIRSLGDCISYVRDGLTFAKAQNADVFINVWNTELDEKYNIKTELPNAEVIKNPVQVCSPLRSQLIDFANIIASKL